MTAQTRTETTQGKTIATTTTTTTAAGRKARAAGPRPRGGSGWMQGETVVLRHRRASGPRPRGGSGSLAICAAAAAAVLAAAFAAGAVSAYGEGPEPGADAMAAATSMAAAADGAGAGDGAAHPAGGEPAPYMTACGPMYGGHPAGAAGEPSPGQAANMTSRMDALYAEYDAILAGYGFEYREPANLTGAQMDRIEAEMRAATAKYDGMLDRVANLTDRSDGALLGPPFAYFGPQATLMAVYQLITDEHDDVLRKHGFVVSTPQLSDADERRLAERLDAVMDRIDRVYEEYCMVEPSAPPGAGGAGGADGDFAGHGHGAFAVSPYGIAHAADGLYAEHEAILAEYGFEYREPANLTDAQLDQLDARLGRLFERHTDAAEDLAGRLAPLLASGGIAVGDAFAKDERLADRSSAEHTSILAEFGYVIVIPELSSKDREAMNKRLADVYARIGAAFDAAYPAYGAGEAGGNGDGGQAAARAPASSPPEPPLPAPGNGSTAVYDAFDEDERRAAQAGAEHSAPADEYDYLTVTPEPSSENGTVVNEGLADIYDRIEAALDEWYAATQSPAHGDEGNATHEQRTAAQSPAYGGDERDEGEGDGSDGNAPLEEWYMATQSPAYGGDERDEGDGSGSDDATYDDSYSVTYRSASDDSGNGDEAAAADDRTS